MTITTKAIDPLGLRAVARTYIIETRFSDHELDRLSLHQRAELARTSLRLADALQDAVDSYSTFLVGEPASALEALAFRLLAETDILMPSLLVQPAPPGNELAAAIREGSRLATYLQECADHFMRCETEADTA